jgi:hypothetical protein
MAGRVSWEGDAVDALVHGVGPMPNVIIYRGLGSTNRVVPDGWGGLSALQSFQFGDLRFESSDVRVVVEVESAGGATNLVKYWPMLASGLRDKRFVLLHLFRLTSRGDYLAHRALWTFVRDRMQADLKDRCGLQRGTDWTADLLTYGPGSPSDGIAIAAARIREALRAPAQSVVWAP